MGKLSNGKWTSKLGGGIDISHDLRDVEGPIYGKMLRIYTFELETAFQRNFISNLS